MLTPRLWDHEIATDNLNQICLDAALSELDFKVILKGLRGDHPKDISSSAPLVAAFMQKVKEAVVSGFRFCIVDGLRFEEIESNPLLLHAYILQLCSLIGQPTQTDQKDGSVIWPIKPVAGLTSENATYSQHHEAADLHTDTQYFAKPEEVMTLWCLRPDKEGQGESLLAAGRTVIARLSETLRSDVLRLLSQPIFPFKVPSVFTKEGTDDCVEVFVGPVISEVPLMRYRRQTIDRARLIDKYSLEPEVIETLDAMDSVLSAPDIPLKIRIERGQVLFVNNHEILHGRTAFHDMERHLLRVRLNFSH